MHLYKIYRYNIDISNVEQCTEICTQVLRDVTYVFFSESLAHGDRKRLTTQTTKHSQETKQKGTSYNPPSQQCKPYHPNKTPEKLSAEDLLSHFRVSHSHRSSEIRDTVFFKEILWTEKNLIVELLLTSRYVFTYLSSNFISGGKSSKNSQERIKD
jgi:hypothetical protein